jgi:hypothetical protein
MTTDEFWTEVYRIADSFICEPLTQVTEFRLKSAIQGTIYDLYACGGYVLDNLQVPILDVEDVEVVVSQNLQSRSVSVSIVRRAKGGNHGNLW